jgi:hypothetical protein
MTVTVLDILHETAVDLDNIAFELQRFAVAFQATGNEYAAGRLREYAMYLEGHAKQLRDGAGLSTQEALDAAAASDRSVHNFMTAVLTDQINIKPRRP